MHKAALGEATVLLEFAQASAYLETVEKGPPRILVTREIDWSWARIVGHFEAVITDRGTRISRGSEVLMIMDKPGVLGAKTATEVLRSGGKVRIVCSGNEAFVHWIRHDGLILPRSPGFSLVDRNTLSHCLCGNPLSRRKKAD